MPVLRKMHGSSSRSFSIIVACALVVSDVAAQSATEDTLKQVPVDGAGTGVVIDVTLRRGRETWGNGGGSPTWEVRMSVSNYGVSAASIGNTMSVVEVNEDSAETLGLYVFRDGKPPLATARQFETRYGMTWGVVVPAGAVTPWPWGSATGGMDANSAFSMLLSAPWASGFSAGGYPVVKAKSRYTLLEKIMAPLQLRKGGRRLFVVIPPRIRSGTGGWIQPFFEFRPNGDDSQYTASGKGSLMATAASLTPIIADSSAPTWKRVLALSLLAEGSFQTAVPVLLAKAADDAAPEALRFSAILNLGVAAYKTGIPALVNVFKTTQSPRVRIAVIAALGEIGDSSAASVVREAISSPDSTLRNVSIANAGKLKDHNAVPHIVAVLGSSRNVAVRSLALDALGQIGSPDAMLAVVGVAQDARADFQVRRTAMAALGASPSAAGETALIAILISDSNAGMRLNAIAALGKFKAETVLLALRQAAVTGFDAMTKWSCSEVR